MSLKHQKITHASQLAEHSSWRSYQRKLLELKLEGSPQEAFAKESAKSSFLAFCDLVSEAGGFSLESAPLDAKAYEVVGSAFEDIAEGKYQILLVSMPPRTGKTTLGVHLLSWLLSKDPMASHFVTSYTQNHAASVVHTTKHLVQSPSFRKYSLEGSWFMPIRVSPVSFGGSVRGDYYGSSYGTPGVWLIDDCHNGVSDGSVTKKQIREIGDHCVGKSGATVVLGSRLGEGDIFSYFLEKYGVFDPVSNPKGAVHINLSAIIESKEEVEADIPGGPVGGSLGRANQYLSPENLKDLRRILGDEKFSWLYKGYPPVSEAPLLDKVIISVDPTCCSDSIDKVGICIAGVTKQRDYMYVLDTYEGNWDLTTVGVILSLAVKAYGAEEIVLESGLVSATWAVYLQSLGLEVRVGSRQKSKVNAIIQMRDSGKVKFSSSDTLSALDGCDNLQISLSDTMCAVLVSYSQLLPTVV
jgi:hypothetical protein